MRVSGSKAATSPPPLSRVWRAAAATGGNFTTHRAGAGSENKRRACSESTRLAPAGLVGGAPLDRFVAYIWEHVLGMQPEGSANEPTRGPQMRVMRDA